MATYRLSEDAVSERLAKAQRWLRVKYGILTLIVAGLAVLNYRNNDQRHWQTELGALVLCAILLIAGYGNGRRTILLGKGSPKQFYELTVGRDSVSCRDIVRGDAVLHVSEVSRVDSDGDRGLVLRSSSKGRVIRVPKDIERFNECVAELQRVGLNVRHS